MDPLGYLYSIHMPNMAKKAEQEVDPTKQEVGLDLGNGAFLSKMDKDFDPLGYLLNINVSNMAEQEVGSNLGHIAS